MGHKEQVGVGVLHRHDEFLALTYISTEGLRGLHFLVLGLAMVAQDPAPHAFTHKPLHFAQNNAFKNPPTTSNILYSNHYKTTIPFKTHKRNITALGNSSEGIYHGIPSSPERSIMAPPRCLHAGPSPPVRMRGLSFHHCPLFLGLSMIFGHVFPMLYGLGVAPVA